MEDPDTSATAKQLKNSTRQPGCSSTTMEDPDSFSTTKLEMLQQLFLYECEKSCAKKLKSVISSKKMVESVRIPGAKVEENNPEIKIATELNKLTRPARTIGKGLTQIMSVMHSLGFSLNGSFAVQDIFCLPGLKIKLRADLKKSICKATDETNRQDYLKLRKIMKNDLLAGCPIPKDVEVWLFHMRNDPIKNEPLIRYNLCLMDQVVQLSHLRTLYERFKQIEAVEKIRAEIMKEMASKNQGRNEMDDETQASASKDATEQTKNNELRRSGSKVSKVLSYMRSGEKNWFPAAEHNQFVLEAYNYHLRLTDGINKDERSLTTILRHCANHLIDYSVDEETGEILFQDFEMYYIIEGTFPGALSKFQQGMHSIGELEYPSLNEQMRARMSWFE